MGSPTLTHTHGVSDRAALGYGDKIASFGAPHSKLGLTVRLSTAQAELIKEHVRNIFGQDAEVWLFGSRVYDELKGGDIDLLVSSPAAICERVTKTCRLHAALQLALGEQKIDIVTLDPTMTIHPIHESAKLSGVRL